MKLSVEDRLILMAVMLFVCELSLTVFKLLLKLKFDYWFC